MNNDEWQKYVESNCSAYQKLPYCAARVLSFNLSRDGKAQVRFNGQVTQEAIKKLIALLDLSVDTYPTQSELDAERSDHYGDDENS